GLRTARRGADAPLAQVGLRGGSPGRAAPGLRHAGGDPGPGRRHKGGDMSQGLVIVNTGNGKGKTTAALGTLLRAWGRGMRVCVIQFIKAETGNWGEIRAARKLHLDWQIMGDGFTWLSKDLDETAEKTRRAWALAQEKIAGGDYDLVILDEMTYAFTNGWIDVNQAIAWLKEYKPA